MTTIYGDGFIADREDDLLRQSLKALEEWRDQQCNNADADLIETLRAALNGAQTAWRPMDSAPRDGTPILAFNPITGPYKTRFECDQFPMADWMGKVGGDVVPGIWYPKPTHWMPLPPPPESKEG